MYPKILFWQFLIDIYDRGRLCENRCVRASMNWAGIREVQGHWAHGACAYRKLVDKTSPVAPFH